jgi:hypothetical protein
MTQIQSHPVERWTAFCCALYKRVRRSFTSSRPQVLIYKWSAPTVAGGSGHETEPAHRAGPCFQGDTETHAQTPSAGELLSNGDHRAAYSSLTMCGLFRRRPEGLGGRPRGHPTVIPFLFPENTMLDWPATNKVLDGVDEVSRLTTVRSKGGTAMVDHVVPGKRPPKRPGQGT